MSAPLIQRVSLHELELLVRRALEQKGYPPEEVEILAAILIHGALSGSQGPEKILAMHFDASEDIEEVDWSMPVMGRLNAAFHDGMVAADVAIEEAARRARQYGLAQVSVTNTSSSSGAIGYPARLYAIAHRVVVQVFTSTPPLVAPLGGIDRRVGTNPLAIAIPWGDGQAAVFDATTAGMAWYDLLQARDRGEEIPPGVGVDQDGRAATNAAEVITGGALLPRPVFGALGSMFHLLSLSTQLYDDPCNAAWGLTVFAWNPAVHIGWDDYSRQVERYLEFFRQSRSMSDLPVRLPGEGWESRVRAGRERGWVEMPHTVYEQLREIAGQ